jgi:4-hydroxybenzoate polyprenyltransferase
MHALKVARRLVMISRPLFWMAALAVFAGGFLLGGADFSWAVFVAAFYCTVPMGVVVYGINDIADRESDAQNARKGDGMEGVVLQRSDMKLLAIWVTIFAVIPPVIFAATGRYLAAAAILVVLLFSYLYSVDPFRFKVRPVIDSLSNGLLWVLPMFLLGYFVDTTGFDAVWPHWQILTVIVLCTAASHAIAAAMDYEADKLVHDTTIAVALGMRGTLYFALLMFVISFYLLHEHPSIAVYTGVCAVATAAALLRPTRTVMVWLARCTVGLVLVLAAYIALRVYL